MNTPLIVTGQMKVQSGKEQLLIDLLVAQLARVHAQPGNLYADLVQNREDPTEFLLYEIWRSEQDLDWDLQQDYTRKVFQQFEELLAQPIRVTKYQLHATNDPQRMS